MAEAEFPVHTITVTVGGNDDNVEYEIDHGACLERGEVCIVEGTVHELGLQSALYGVWQDEPELERGAVYRVRGWVSKHDVPGEPVEYDAGIEEVDDDE